MTSNFENHRQIDWAEVDFGLREDFAVKALSDGNGFTVEGVCPGCGAMTSDEWILAIPGYKGREITKHTPEQPKPGPRTVGCDCGSPHANRPPGGPYDGCGATWKVNLP